jgi:hypothetical protein
MRSAEVVAAEASAFVTSLPICEASGGKSVVVPVVVAMDETSFQLFLLGPAISSRCGQSPDRSNLGIAGFPQSFLLGLKLRA